MTLVYALFLFAFSLDALASHPVTPASPEAASQAASQNDKRIPILFQAIADQKDASKLHLARQILMNAFLEKHPIDFKTLHSGTKTGENLVTFAARVPPFEPGQPLLMNLILESIKPQSSDDFSKINNFTPLMIALNSGNAGIAEALVKRGKANVNAVGPNGATPLVYALAKGLIPPLQLLLDHGVNLDQPLLFKGERMDALKWAIAMNRLDIAEIIRAEIHKRQEDKGMTALTQTLTPPVHATQGEAPNPPSPIDEAFEKSSYRMMVNAIELQNDGYQGKSSREHAKRILDLRPRESHPFDLKKPIPGGRLNLVAYAAQIKAKKAADLPPPVLDLLLDYIHPQSSDDYQVDGITPLMHAVLKGNLEGARTLLEKGGADINTLYYGKTPLFYAVRNGDSNLVKLLRDHRARLDLPFSEGGWQGTVQDYAKRSGMAVIVSLLRQSLPDLNQKLVPRSTCDATNPLPREVKIKPVRPRRGPSLLGKSTADEETKNSKRKAQVKIEDTVDPETLRYQVLMSEHDYKVAQEKVAQELKKAQDERDAAKKLETSGEPKIEVNPEALADFKIHTQKASARRGRREAGLKKTVSTPSLPTQEQVNPSPVLVPAAAKQSLLVPVPAPKARFTLGEADEDEDT